MRRAHVLCLAVFVVLSSLSMAPEPVVADNEDPGPDGKIFGDWNISVQKSYSDRTIEVTGNITILNGGSLSLDNVTLIVNSSIEEEYWITVELGGDLTVLNGSVITNNQTHPRPYYIVSEYGASLTVRDSVLMNMGNHTIQQDFGLDQISKVGLLVQGNAVSLRDSVIRDNYAGTVCYNLLSISPTISNVTYLNNTIGLTPTLSCSPSLEGNRYIDNEIGLSVLMKATFGIEGEVFDHNNASLVASGVTNLNVKDVSISNSTSAGLMLLGNTNATVETSRISDTVRNATFVDGSDLWIKNSVIENSGELDFLVQNSSYANVLNTTLDDRNGILVNDTSSTFERYWHLLVRARYPSGDPVAGALVNMTDSKGVRVVSTATDGNGDIPREQVMEMRDEGQGLDILTPHVLTAEKGPFWNMTEVTLTASRSLVLTLVERDLVPPDLSIDEPVNGTHTNRTSLHVEGTAQDNRGVSLVQVALDGGNWADAQGTENWSADLIMDGEGEHQICVRARDPSGNNHTECISAILDTLPPTLNITEPVEGQLFNHTQLFVRGTTDADKVIVNSENVTIFNGSFSHPLALPAEGENMITVHAEDMAGNGVTRQITVYRDLISPSINITRPGAGSVVNNTTVGISGNISDASGITDLYVSTDNQTWIAVEADFTSEENQTGTFDTDLLLEEGENTVFVRARDRAGNVAFRELNIVVVLPDQTPPEVSIISPHDGDRVDDAVITISGTADDNEGLTNVEVRVNDGPWIETRSRDGWSTWKINVTLEEGENLVIARAFDGQGNSADFCVTVSYILPMEDQEPPEITVTSHEHNDVVHKRGITLEGMVSDNVEVRAVYVSITGAGDDAEWVLANLSSGSGNRTWSLKVKLKEGWNEIAVKAVDSSSNNDTAFLTVNYQKDEGEGGLNILAIAMTIIVIVLLVIVYFLTLPGRRRARRMEDEPVEEEHIGEEE